MKDTLKTVDQDEFNRVGVEDLDKIILILRSRLPRCAHMYNTAMLLKEIKFDVSFFTLYGDLSHNSWIVSTIERPDYGKDISISVPLNPVVTDKIKSAFQNTSIFDWNNRYMFTAIENSITAMIVDVAAVIKGNSITVLPSFAYTMDLEYATRIETKLPAGLEMRNLNNETGVDFILKTWRYSLDGSKEYIQTAVKATRSCGLYQGEECVSGILHNFNGLLGLLHTSEAHRGRGLAPICMRQLSKNVAESGMIPVSTVEKQNVTSIAFHDKIGMTKANECVFIFHSAYKWAAKK